MTRDLSAIFKAYDVRGVYPDQLDEDAARRIGVGFATFAGAPAIAMGRDMRLSSPSLAEAFAEGATGAGIEVLDLGLVSTDAMYFASGKLGVPGAIFTASHNPPEYNGLKLCRESAAPIGVDSGLADIRAIAEKADDSGGGRRRAGVRAVEILEDYAAHCTSLIDSQALRPFKVAIDAGNGMAAKTVPTVFAPLPLEVVPLYFELDGSFPNHPPNPIDPVNLVELQRVVTEGGCDVGIAFDGDADRIFLVDEKGGIVSGSATTALVAKRVLEKHPGETIIYNLICSRAVPEIIEECGGRAVRSRVGHSFIKELMALTGAIFAGEHSGHYYFRDNFRADSGMIAALTVLEAMSLESQPLSELLAPLMRYASSGEINSVVEEPVAVLEHLAEIYSDGRKDVVDGLTIEYDEWWFNCRPSNTEPLVRLNVEARTPELMNQKKNDLLSLIRDPARRVTS